MRGVTALVLLVAVVLTAQAVPSTAQLLDSPWPAFRHDALHTGRATLEGPGSGLLRWTYAVGGDGACSPAVGNGVVYVAGAGALVAVDSSGNLQWSYPCAAGRSSPAVAANGTIYLATADGWLHAINPNGTLKWKKALAGPSDASPTVSPDGSVCVGCSTGRFISYRSDGSLKFIYNAPAPIVSSAAVAPDGTIYFGCDDGKLYALYAGGALKWQFATSPSAATQASPSIGPDGTIYFGSLNGYFYALWPSGVQRWRYSAGGSIYSSPALAQDGSIYFGCRDGYLYCVTGIGALKWKYPAGGYVDSSPAVDSAGTIYVGSNGGSMHAVSPSGAQAWSLPIGTAVISSPAIGSSGVIYVATYDGMLCALGSDTTPPIIPTVIDDGAYTASADSLHARWISSDPESGISRYEYALGTAPGAEDVVPFTDAGLAVEVTASGLSLVNGKDYYFAVRATNTVGLVSAVGVSNGIKVDFTPPVVPIIIDDGIYTGISDRLHFAYSSGDPESGIDHYEYSIGTGPGLTDVLGWVSAGLTREQTVTGLTLSHGVSYFANVRAYNRAGLVREASSNGIKVDLTAPTVSSVEVHASLAEMRVTVTASDPESGISSIQYVLLDSPTLPPSPAWTSSPPGQEIVIPGPFAPGKTYYVAARAANGLQVWSEAKFSDLILLDETPPTTPEVVDDGDYWSDPSTLRAAWSSQDPESGIHHYSCCLGSSAGLDDVVGWQDTTQSSITLTGLSLANGGRYYFTVRSVNNAGLQSAEGSSDGITIDTTPPAVPVVTDDGDYTSVPDSLHAVFESVDEESGIVEYTYCIGASPNSDDIVPWTSTGAQGSAVAYGLSLQEGVPYYFSVKARNGAGQWSGVGVSDGIQYRPAVSVWPKFRYDLRNTGRSEVNGPLTGRLDWRAMTQGYVESSAAIAGDGTAYIGSSDGKLYAVSVGGAVRWTYQTGAAIDSSPAIGPDSEIYFGSGDRGLYCLYPSGMLKWKFTAGGMIWSSPAVGPDGAVYFGCQDGGLYALNADGTIKWHYQTDAAIWSSPALAPDGAVYFGSGDGLLYALTSAGRLKWYFRTGSAVDCSPAIGDGGEIYFGSGDGYFYAVNSDGALLWNVNIGDVVDSSAAISPDGTIYVGSGGGLAGSFHALSPDGEILWRLDLQGAVRSSPVLGMDGRVYFGCSDGNVYCVTPDGSILWSYKSEQSMLSSPALAANGSLVIGSDDGWIYCFKDYGGTDTTPPSVPTVHVQNTTIAPGDPLVCEWSAVDAESGIESYSYAIGTQPATDNVVPWTNSGRATSISRSDLPLTPGQMYYVSVKARDYALLVSGVGVSEAVQVVPAPPISIGAARRLAAGSQVHLSGKVVTAVFDDCFFIEEPDRSAGVRCVVPFSDLVAGIVVDVTAVVGSSNGEIVLTAPTFQQAGSASAEVAPLGMCTRAFSSAGLDPRGLLVRITGRVTRAASDYFILHDGALLSSPRQAAGIEVRVGNGQAPPVGAKVSVTGVACIELVYSVPVTIIRTTDAPEMVVW